MRHVPTLLRRELAAYFLGPMAYLILLAFQTIAWINFDGTLESLARRPRIYAGVPDPLNYYLAGSPPFWIALMVALPALTMRLVAEERRSGTIETLLTVPVTETEVVVAKWLAALVMYLVLLLPFAVYLPFLYHQGKFYFDLGPVASLAIGMTTIGMMFSAIGVMFSAATRNQIVAAIWTFVVMFALLFLPRQLAGTMATMGTPARLKWAEVMQFVSVLDQAMAFGLGQVDLRVVVLHLSICVFALGAAVRVLQWRRGA
jgi:ABC-2 type transport system permease protein